MLWFCLTLWRLSCLSSVTVVSSPCCSSLSTSYFRCVLYQYNCMTAVNFLFPVYFDLQLGRRIQCKMLCSCSVGWRGKERVARKGVETCFNCSCHQTCSRHYKFMLVIWTWHTQKKSILDFPVLYVNLHVLQAPVGIQNTLRYLVVCQRALPFRTVHHQLKTWWNHTWL